MKIRELKRLVGETRVSVWPPQWASSYARGDKFPMGEQGTLSSVRRINDRLSLTMAWNEREHTGVLEWTPPPSVEDVEAVLQRQIGGSLAAIGDVDIRAE